MLPSVTRTIALWNKQATNSLISMSDGAWRLPLMNELGRKTLKALVTKLQLRFPVEFVYNPGASWQSAEAVPMLFGLRKEETGKTILVLKHRFEHGERVPLRDGIRFLIRAKMIETGFPGLMFEGDRSKRHVYGEISYQIREPYFPGGETPFLGRVYPYPVFRITDFFDLLFMHGAIEDFYIQELLARLYPQYDVGGELYEFNLWLKVPPSHVNISDPFDRRHVINGIAVIAAELKLEYSRKWNRLAGIVSSELSQIYQSHGATLFLEVLKHKCGRDFVANAFSILEQLPLEDGGGFGPPLLHDIHRVLNEISALHRTSRLMRREEIERLGMGVKLNGEFAGIRGVFEIETGPQVVFRQACERKPTNQ